MSDAGAPAVSAVVPVYAAGDYGTQKLMTFRNA